MFKISIFDLILLIQADAHHNANQESEDKYRIMRFIGDFSDFSVS